MYSSAEDRIEKLVINVPVVTPETTCDKVYRLFQQDEDLLAIAVLSDGKPVGIAHRVDLILSLADKFGNALYAHKPVETLMNKEPLIVDASNSVDFLSNLLAYDATNALLKGFIICRGDEYLGMGTAISLLQTNIERSRKKNEELQQAKNVAIQANKSKSVFLANMNHELRTPLNAIIGFTDMMQQEAYGAIPQEEYREYIDIVNSSGHHLLSVINMILDMSKIEAGKMEPKNQEVDVYDLIQLVRRMMTSTAEKKNITIKAECADDVPDILGDMTLLRQVILNLVSNAIKFSHDNSEVNMSVKINEQGQMVIQVIDQGVGISDKDRENVLKPFFQVDGELSRAQEGTGLGLSIVKAYLDIHGATFDLNGELGVGTTATITMPASRIVEDDYDLAVKKQQAS